MTAVISRSTIAVGLILLLAAPGCSRTGTDSPDISQVGGTVLVYEVPKGADGKPGRPIAEWVTAIKRRIDPAEVGTYTVRVAGASGFEIAVPRGIDRKTDEENINEVKQLLTDGPDTGPRLGLRLVQEKAVEPK